MAIIELKKEKNFTTVSNDILRSKNLSQNAKLVLITLLSYPSDWKPNIKAISKEMDQCVSTTKKTFRELKDKNYIHLHKLGFFKSWEYFVFNQPITPDEFKNYLRNRQDSNHETKKNLRTDQNLTQNLKKSLRTDQNLTDVLNTKKEIYKKEIYKEKRAAPHTSAQASVLCNYFLNSIKNKKQDFVRDISPCWLTQADQLLNTRSVEQIKRVIDYAHKSEYWFARLLSMKALKNCLDTIELQMVHRFKRKIPTIDNTQTIEYRKSWAYQHEYTAPGGYAMALEDRYIVVDGGQVKELYYNADVPDWITLATNPIADQQLKCI